MSWVSNIIAKSPIVTSSKSYSYGGGGLFRRNGSVSMTPQTAMQLTTVFACNRVIAETISSISLDVFELVDGGKEKATNHSLYTILKYNPNPNMTSVMWREMIVQDLNTRGNHYSQIIRNKNKDVVSIFPLKTDNMSVKQLDSGKIEYTYDTGKGKINVPASEVLHVVGLPSENGITGLSPIQYNRAALELGATTQQFGMNFFEKGANASGAFYTPGELSDEAYKRLKNDLGSNYIGLLHSGKPLLLEGGLKFERISIPNNDAQFLETRKYQKEEIASIFRVPMHMINSLENATFSNIEHQSLEFVQFTILPWVKRMEQAFNLRLLSHAERQRYTIKFNVDTLLRGDFKTRTDGYQTLIQNGVMSINEVRALENMNKVDGGDKRFMQLNMTTIEKIGEKNESN